MIYTSLAVVALSASAAVSPLSHMVHMHPRAAQSDQRVSLTVRNTANTFQDVKVAGHSYTLQANHSMLIKAPIGTVVYADSSTSKNHRGDVIAELGPATDKKFIELK